MVGLAIASGCIEDVCPRNLAHIAIFVCPLRFAHFGPKFLQFGGFRWLLETRRLRNALATTWEPPRCWWVLIPTISFVWSPLFLPHHSIRFVIFSSGTPFWMWHMEVRYVYTAAQRFWTTWKWYNPSWDTWCKSIESTQQGVLTLWYKRGSMVTPLEETIKGRDFPLPWCKISS